MCLFASYSARRASDAVDNTSVGETGDGKSSLLAAVTGDMPLRSGEMKVDASIAYVPQESWVFNGARVSYSCDASMHLFY